jgi:putative DNA primase/helicase
MRQRSIEPPPDLIANGKKITWAGDARRPKKKNAWCVLHEWTSPKTGRTFVVGRYGIRDEHWAIEPTQTEWSPAEKTAWIEKRKAIEKEADDDRRAAATTAREKALKLWERARTDGVSDYLNRKQVAAYGIRFAFGSVLVPVTDLAGVLHGLQWVAADGGKVFGTGTVKEGHFHLLGEVADGVPIAFAEGYATAATGHKATGWPVVACFDAGNLMPVVAAWRRLYPDHRFVMFADDDRHLVGRLCERLGLLGVAVGLADFAKSAGGLRDMRWDLPDGKAVVLKARWAKDKCEVYYIEGSIEADGVTQLLRLENAGRAKAFAAAKRHGAHVVLPRFADRATTGTDFNDLHVAEGLEVAAQQLTAEPAQPNDSPKQPQKNGQPPGGGGSNSGGGHDDGGAARLRFPYLDEKFRVRGIRENVYYALGEDPDLRELVRYNDFSQQIDKARPAPWGGVPGGWLSMDDLRLANYVAERHGLVVGNPVTVEQAVTMAAQDMAYNPVRSDLESVPWDKVPRCEHWMVDCLGAADSEYVRKVSLYFLISLVARVFEPGCQMDYMLVLQGGQGAGKSSVLQVLGGAHYGAGSFRIGDKDALQALQGRLIFNFNELDSLSRAEGTAIKGFITERTDRFRPPYAKGFQAFPRNCVLTGDTNQGEFLRDATGDRRFWVVHCADIDVAKMIEWRAQLLAEAVYLYKRGHVRYPSKTEEKRLFFPEQDKWKFIDVWQDALARYVNSQQLIEGFDGCTSEVGLGIINSERAFFSTHELLTKALNIDVGKIDRAGTMQRSVGNSMKLLGFESYKWPKGRARPRGYLRSLDVAETQPAGHAQLGASSATQPEGPDDEPF